MMHAARIGAAPRRASRRLARLMLWALLGWSLVTGGCGGGGPAPYDPLDYVLDPQKVHYGGSYSDWAVMWAQWAFEQERPNHPLFDQVGTDALQGQVPPVYFLGGLFGLLWQPSVVAATRDVTIPADTALYFPIVNSSWDNQWCMPPDWVPVNAATLAQYAFESTNQVHSVLCELDGVKIIDSPDYAGCQAYRAVTGTYAYTLPVNHIGIELCGVPPGPIHIDPSVSDGIWMFLAPLPPGQHTLKFAGSQPVLGGGDFRLEVTYNLTVLP